MSQEENPPRQNLAIMTKRKMSAAELGKKRIEIGAVIDFCSAHGLNQSRQKIFDFFEVPKSTGQYWFPGSYSPNRQRPTQPANTSSTPSISSTSLEQSPPAKRQNPVRNGGRDRQKLKLLIEDLAEDVSDASCPPPLSSPSPSHSDSASQPEEPLTPAERKIAQPRKKGSSRSGRQFKHEGTPEVKTENLDDETEI